MKKNLEKMVRQNQDVELVIKTLKDLIKFSKKVDCDMTYISVFEDIVYLYAEKKKIEL